LLAGDDRKAVRVMQAVEELAEETKRNVDQLAGVVTEELAVALAEAAEDDERWARVEDDAKAFLTERGIDLPDEVQIRDATSLLLQPLREGGEYLGQRPQCEKVIQLYIERSPKPGIGVKFPGLLLCVKWA
jgi:hypothetical protein